MTTTFIGFGHKARSGKDTAAQAIIDAFKHKYHIRKYALSDALKVEVYDALYLQKLHGYALPYAVGYGKPPCEVLTCDTAAEKIQFVNDEKTRLRVLLQRWGTEYRRAANESYWVDILDRRIREEAPQLALITDLRFRNEMGWVRGRGGVCVRVTRLGLPTEHTAMGHVSETELDGVEFDHEIAAHSGEPDKLGEAACNLFEMIVGLRAWPRKVHNATMTDIPAHLCLGTT